MDRKRKEPGHADDAQRTKYPRLDNGQTAESDFQLLEDMMAMSPAQIGQTGEDFARYFDRLSQLLLNSVTLVVNQVHHFRLVEVEFYLRGGTHQDVFAHTNPEQLTCSLWSFHRQNESFRGGSYKGLDITFGAHGTCYGGILIRGLQVSNQPHSKVTEGPCKVVEKILEKAGCEKIIDLVNHPDYAPHVFSKNSIMRLAPIKQEVQRPIYKGPRVGLNLKDLGPERIVYMMKDYRYLIVPDQTTKGKPYIILSLHRQGKGLQEITQITQAKVSAVKNYISLYEANTLPIEHFLGMELGINQICQLYSAIAKRPFEPHTN